MPEIVDIAILGNLVRLTDISILHRVAEAQILMQLPSIHSGEWSALLPLAADRAVLVLNSLKILI